MKTGAGEEEETKGEREGEKREEERGGRLEREREEEEGQEGAKEVGVERLMSGRSGRGGPCLGEAVTGHSKTTLV